MKKYINITICLISVGVQHVYADTIATNNDPFVSLNRINTTHITQCIYEGTTEIKHPFTSRIVVVNNTHSISKSINAHYETAFPLELNFDENNFEWAATPYQCKQEIVTWQAHKRFAESPQHDLSIAELESFADSRTYETVNYKVTGTLVSSGEVITLHEAKLIEISPFSLSGKTFLHNYGWFSVKK